MKIFYYLTALLLAVSNLSAEEAALAATRPTLPLELDLETASALALIHNPGTAQARELVRRADSEITSLRSTQRPRVGVDAAYAAYDDSSQQQFNPDMPSEDTRWDVNAEASLYVYSGGRANARIKSAKSTQAARSTAVTLEEQALLLAVHQAYTDALLAEQRTDVETEAQQVLKEQVRLAESLFDAGAGTRFEVLQAQSTLAGAAPTLIRARNDRLRAVERLRRLIGLPYPDDTDAEDIQLDPLDPGQSPFDSLGTALEAGAENRPELKQLAQLVEAEQYRVKSIKREHMPLVDIFAGYGAESDQFDAGEMLHGWSAGVRMSLDLFDGGDIRGRAEQSASDLASLFLQQDEMLLSIDHEIRTAFYDLQEARERLTASAVSTEQSSEALRLARNRFEAGQGTQLEVFQAQLTHTRARLEEITASADLQLASVQLRKAAGIPLDPPAPEPIEENTNKEETQE